MGQKWLQMAPVYESGMVFFLPSMVAKEPSMLMRFYTGYSPRASHVGNIDFDCFYQAGLCMLSKVDQFSAQYVPLKEYLAGPPLEWVEIGQIPFAADSQVALIYACCELHRNEDLAMIVEHEQPSDGWGSLYGQACDQVYYLADVIGRMAANLAAYQVF
jgi:hypothetical protein